MSITFVGDAFSTSATCGFPAGIQAGDFAIATDRAVNTSGTPTTVEDGNFTTIGSILTAGNAKHIMAYRVLTGGETTYTGMDGTSNDSKRMLVFRSDVAGTWEAPAGINEEGTTGDPSNQTVTVGAAPLVVVAIMLSSGTVSPITFSPSGTIWGHGRWRIDNSSPSNTTVGMDDEGTYNFLKSFYVSFTEAPEVARRPPLITRQAVVRASVY